MTRLILFAIAFSSLLLVSPAAHAKTFGGFEVGQTFTLKVVKVTSTKKTGLAGPEETAPIHSKAAKYRKGQSITFRIRAGGKLTARGISIPFAHASRTVNEYNLSRGGTIAITRTAEISRKGRSATGGYLYFFITDNSGMETVYYTVVYKLK